ncbi:hypothetical protein Val02_41310 [Virgisporangium aliadipatigenens]|uniref:Uncharacterized protein n=2 Tax=Virgisporangium aliadipatigenens TaxID=741659 RepID=A0A8J4DQP0_9ACTN|nr:hypothetical protein Val02_41310 [Virgisporangium aliadipatigenens]
MRVHCQIEVLIDDPERVHDLAERQLRDANIDWDAEQDTLEEAVAEMRGDLAQAVASLVDPEGLLPGFEVRGGRWWAERSTD